MKLKEIMERWGLSRKQAVELVAGIKYVPAHFEKGRQGKVAADYDGDQVCRKRAAGVGR